MLRITGGTFKGRAIKIPPSSITRPASNRVRQAIFNILDNYLDIDDSIILDIFAGSGAVGFEALSRGAKHLTCIEKNPLVCNILKENVLTLEIQSQVDIFQCDALGLPKAKEPADVIFIDPPYKMKDITTYLTEAAQKGWMKNGSLIVSEVEAKTTFDLLPPFFMEKEYLYGQTKICLIRYEED